MFKVVCDDGCKLQFEKITTLEQDNGNHTVFIEGIEFTNQNGECFNGSIAITNCEWFCKQYETGHNESCFLSQLLNVDRTQEKRLRSFYISKLA